MLSVNIDEHGFYLPGSEYEDLLHDGIPQPPNGLWKPRWDGTNWVEGATKGEIAFVSGQPQTLEEIKKAKRQEIVNHAAALQEALIDGYPPAERDTWGKKAALSKAFQESDNIEDAGDLVIEASYASSAITELEIKEATRKLTQKILAKADYLYKTSFKLSGIRSFKIDLMKELLTIEEVEAFDYKSGWD